MTEFGKTIYCLLKRPLAVLIIALCTLLTTAVCITTLLPVLRSISLINSENPASILLILLKLVARPKTLLLLIVMIPILSIITAVPAAFILSGIAPALKSSAEGLKLPAKWFSAGFRRYFTRFLIYSFIIFMVGLLYLSVVIVALIPFITLLGITSARPGMAVASWLIGILTFLAVTYISFYYRVYFFSIFPAITGLLNIPHGKGRSYGIGFKMRVIADNSFWKSVVYFFLFDVVFLFIMYYIYISGIDILFFFMAWLAITFYFVFFTMFFSVVSTRLTKKLQ